MDYTIEEDFQEYCGTISNMHGFLHRYLDTGFKTKWAGYWVPPNKFMDYYAFEVNGKWLSPETLVKTEYGDKIIYHHNLGSLRVKEIVETPEELPGFRVTLEFENLTPEPKAVYTKIELGVDIRHKSEDVENPGYKTEFSKKKLLVESYGRHLLMSSEKPMKMKGKERTREHHPGERQVCMVPGEQHFKVELGPEKTGKNVLEFTTNDQRFGKLDEKENDVELGNNNDMLERAFQCSEESLRNLVYDREGKGVIAGHPWFQEYWSRDAYWSLMGLIDLGYFELSKKILHNFAVQEGFPNQITFDEGKAGYLGEDVPPLFIIAAEELKKYHHVTDETEEKEMEALKHLKIGEGNVVTHKPEGTWMDTLERDRAIDIHSLWLEAVERLGATSKEILQRGMEKFREGDILKDCLEEKKVAVNSAIPLMFGHFEDEKLVEKLNSCLKTDYGAATLSTKDSEYSPEGYHTGSTWGLTTGWLAAANLKNGKLDEGLEILSRFAETVEQDQPGALPEVINSETGENIGCVEQAWSASMVIHVIDRYLFGIDVKDGELVADPVDGFTGKRKYKRFKNNLYHVRVQDGDARIDKVV